MITLFGGKIQGMSNTVCPHGYLVLVPQRDACQTSGPGLVMANMPVVFRFDADGNLVSSPPCQVWSSRELTPSPILVTAQFLDENRSPVNNRTVLWNLAYDAGSSIDIALIPNVMDIQPALVDPVPVTTLNALSGPVSITSSSLTITKPDASTINLESAGGGGVGSPVRQTMGLTTASLAPSAYEDQWVVFSPTFLVMMLGSSQHCRIRIYATDTAREADRARNIDTAPAGNHGVMLDVVLLDGFPWFVSPPAICTVLGGSGTATGQCPVCITNLGSVSQAVSIQVDWLQTENIGVIQES